MGRVCNGLTYNTNTFANSVVAPVKQLLLFLKGDTLHIVPLLQQTTQITQALLSCKSTAVTHSQKAIWSRRLPKLI